jgi:pimeloyl-ACP methyl ester carboxylesterase
MTMPDGRAWLLILGLLAASGPARAAETRPTALLLDGLFIYVHQAYVGVSALAPLLERLGYRAAVDTHLMTRTAREEPVLLVGHSMGGATALRRAREMVEAGKPAPVVITIDAAFGSPPCPVPRCVNYYSPGFPKVEGAENIDAWQAGAFMANHALLATHPAVQRLVLERARALIEERAVSQAVASNAPLSAPVPTPRPTAAGR